MSTAVANGKAGTTNRIKKTPVKKKASKPAEGVRILPIRIKRFTLPVVGTSVLIQHRFGEKARKQISDKQAGKAKEKSVRKPDDEYKSSFYMISGKPGAKRAKYGIPCSAFKNAMVSACRYVDGMAMTVARGAFFVLGADNQDMVTIDSKSGPRMVEDAVRLAGPGSPIDLRYRPYFDDWTCDLIIEFDETVITAEQIVNLANKAGFSVGVQEWRPEKNGQAGRFEVDAKKLRIA